MSEEAQGEEGVNSLLELIAKRKVGERRGKGGDWLIEHLIEREMGEGRWEEVD